VGQARKQAQRRNHAPHDLFRFPGFEER